MHTLLSIHMQNSHICKYQRIIEVWYKPINMDHRRWRHIYKNIYIMYMYIHLGTYIIYMYIYTYLCIRSTCIYPDIHTQCAYTYIIYIYIHLHPPHYTKISPDLIGVLLTLSSNEPKTLSHTSCRPMIPNKHIYVRKCTQIYVCKCI